MIINKWRRLCQTLLCYEFMIIYNFPSSLLLNSNQFIDIIFLFCDSSVLNTKAIDEALDLIEVINFLVVLFLFGDEFLRLSSKPFLQVSNLFV